MKPHDTIAVENSAHHRKLVFWSVIIIFFYALGLRLAYIESAEIDFPIRNDAEKYVTLAANLINHGAYSTQKTPPFLPDTFITPGYPLFLASILKLSPDFAFAYVTIQKLQALLGAITAALVFLIGLEFLPLWGAFLAGCLMVISPHAVITSGYVLTETLFTFLLYLSLYCVIKGFRDNSLKWFIRFGLLAAAAALVRPALLLFPFLIMILAWRHLPHKIRFKASSVTLLTFMALQAPWFAWQQGNTVEGNMSPAIASLALGTYPDLVYKDPKLRGYPYKEDTEWEKMSHSTETTIQTLLQRAKKEPWIYAKWYFLGKPVMFWSWATVEGWDGPFIYPVKDCIYFNYYTAAFSLLFSKWLHPVLLLSACFAILFLLAGFLRRYQPYCSGPGIQIIALCALYFTAVHAVLTPLPRYSIPFHGALFLLATYGFVSIVSFVRRKHLNEHQCLL